MIMFIDKNDVRKIGFFYRLLSGFVFFCALIALVSAIVFGLADDIKGGVLGILVSALILYISIPITFKGYPPKFLLWASGKR